MISKFLSKLKSILFKSEVSIETPLKIEKKPTKLAKSSKTKTKARTILRVLFVMSRPFSKYAIP